MQGWSITSHAPVDVPPQGPFRMAFGHVIGQTYSISPSTQLPQALHPKTGALNASSIFSSAAAAAGRRSIQLRTEAINLRSPVSCRLTGNSVAKVTRSRENTGRG